MQLRALNNQVIVRRDKAETHTPQGIALPDGTRETPCVGTVLAVGPGTVSELTGNLVPTEVKRGQRVAFPKFAGQVVPGMSDVIVVSERELLMVVEEGEEVG